MKTCSVWNSKEISHQEEDSICLVLCFVLLPFSSQNVQANELSSLIQVRTNVYFSFFRWKLDSKRNYLSVVLNILCSYELNWISYVMKILCLDLQKNLYFLMTQSNNGSIKSSWLLATNISTKDYWFSTIEALWFYGPSVLNPTVTVFFICLQSEFCQSRIGDDQGIWLGCIKMYLWVTI